MELTAFHKLRRAVQQNAFPGSDADLTSLAATLQDVLVASGLFAQVEIEPTDDPDKLVIALCSYESCFSESQVASKLERLWNDRLRYGFWEAHAMIVDHNHVELEGASRTSTDGHYVTLHLVAQKARVPAQRRPSD